MQLAPPDCGLPKREPREGFRILIFIANRGIFMHSELVGLERNTGTVKGGDMKPWRLVYCQNKEERGPGSDRMEFVGIRVPPERIVHAAFLDEHETVCGAAYTDEMLPETMAHVFPSCGRCYNRLRSIGSWEKKTYLRSQRNTKSPLKAK